MVFPEADYSKYRDFSPAELFELFFDDELFELVVQQSILYAHSKGETNFFVTKNEIKVFFRNTDGIWIMPRSVSETLLENRFSLPKQFCKQ